MMETRPVVQGNPVLYSAVRRRASQPVRFGSAAPLLFLWWLNNNKRPRAYSGSPLSNKQALGFLGVMVTAAGLLLGGLYGLVKREDRNTQAERHAVVVHMAENHVALQTMTGKLVDHERSKKDHDYFFEDASTGTRYRMLYVPPDEGRIEDLSPYKLGFKWGDKAVLTGWVKERSGGYKPDIYVQQIQPAP